MTSNRIGASIKIGRPPRKDYDADSILRNQIAIVREVYDSCQEIKATALELGLAELKVRKLLITGNIISYEQTDTIKNLQREGKTVDQIMEITGLSRASINGYLPYTKVPYKEAEISSNAEWCITYRKRKAAVEALQEDVSEEKLWELLQADLKKSYDKSKISFTNVSMGGKGDIYLGNLALSYEGNDLLIDSIQLCFFINLNFKLLEILNNVKNRLPNLRNRYPEIEDLKKKYKETHSEELMIQLGEKLATYFVDAKFMAGYWKELFDYLEYDPTFIKQFVATYNARYKFEDDINLPVTVRSSHMLEVKREVKRAIIRDKIRNFWEK